MFFRQLLLSDLGKNTESGLPNRSVDTAEVKVVVVPATASDRS
jgi:hypothetical protein